MHRRLTPVVSLFLLVAVACAVCASPAGEPATQMLSYRLVPKEPLKYKLVADIKGRMPIGESEPVDLTAKLSFTYTALPKTLLSDGTSDVDFTVGPVDLEVLGIPFAVPDEDARKVLNMTVTFAKNGEVLRVQKPSDELPFSVRVQGVDPKRLYALIFPIVFQKSPVREGDTWDYKSELLGGQGATPQFSATLLPAAKGVSAAKVARLKQQFQMVVDQKTDADKKPVATVADAHRVSAGKIDGEGLYYFDRKKGCVVHGNVNIRANIKDSLVGEPEREDEPKELVSRVEAKVSIDLEGSKLADYLPAGSQNPKGTPGTDRKKAAGPAAKKEKP